VRALLNFKLGAGWPVECNGTQRQFHEYAANRLLETALKTPIGEKYTKILCSTRKNP
jgi:hypothetical protein